MEDGGEGYHHGHGHCLSPTSRLPSGLSAWMNHVGKRMTGEGSWMKSLGAAFSTHDAYICMLSERLRHAASAEI